MQKVKKSITISKEVMNMIKQISDILQLTENSIISIAVFEYYRKYLGQNDNFTK